VRSTKTDVIDQETAIRQGDLLTIRLSGITPPSEQQETVNEFGTISGLPFIKEVKAEGLTPGVLAKKIERSYLDGGYYNKISVSVTPGPRLVYVYGEVRIPGKEVLWSQGLTVVKAISLAGGFTDYADRTNLEIQRRDSIIRVNFKDAEHDPAKDVEVYPRDNIRVGRALF
jgi:polysaccharide biosynthesis/export protein VpsN